MSNATNVYLLQLSIYVGAVECNSKRPYTRFTISPLEKISRIGEYTVALYKLNI